MSTQVLVIVTMILPGFSPADAADGSPPIAIAKQQQDFDIRDYEDLINSDLGIPKPGCSLAEMGIPARSVTGQLVDHDGSPLSGIAVAIDQPVGYSSHCYYDNFDTTDESGQFQVAGSVRKTRLVFRRKDGRLWVVHLQPELDSIRVVWPQPATAILRIPRSVAEPGSHLTIRTKRYWAGMGAMHFSAVVSDDETTEVTSLLPGDYYVQTQKTVSVNGNLPDSSVEIAEFSIEAGESIDVVCGEVGKAVLVGSLQPAPAVAAQPPNLPPMTRYVVVRREKLLYEDMPTVLDILVPEDDGNFESRRLPAGVYVVELKSRSSAGAGQFGSGGDSVLKTWRIVIDEGSALIDLNQPDPGESPVAEIIAVLEAVTRPRPRSRFIPRLDVQRLLRLEDRDAVEAELLRLLSDSTTPYDWRRHIPDALSVMTESDRVIDGLLDAAENPVAWRDRREILQALTTAETRVDHILNEVAKYCEHENQITRAVAVGVVGELAVANNDVAERAARLLEAALVDRDFEVRRLAADYLGRLSLKSSLSALREVGADPHGPTAVMAAYAAWKISGDPDDVLPLMTAVLERDGLQGKWEAAYFMKDVAARHEVSQRTRDVLRRMASLADKPPFQSSFEYEKSRAGKAAQQVLDSL